MTKLPYFKLYWKDFLSGTILFSTEEVGAYMKLIIYQWDNGFIPNNPRKLATIAGVRSSKLVNILTKFQLGNDGNLRNQRLELERESIAKFFAQQAENARKGGRPPKTHGIATANPRQSHGKPAANPRQSQPYTEPYINTVGLGENSQWFAMFRRAAGPHINDETLSLEIGKFLNKYPNVHPNKAGALVNTWVGNIGKEEAPVKRMVL